MFAAAAVLAVVAGAFLGLRLRDGKTAHREPGLRVLLVTIDTLRADALGCYGRAGAQTPWIDRLAATGVRFDFAHAHNVVTLPSHASILSGRYPFDHGVRDNAGFRFPPGHGHAREPAPRATAIAPPPSSARFPSTRASASIAASRCTTTVSATPATGSDFRMLERAGPKTVAAASAWLAATPGPTFCWVHLYEPHAPYEPPFDWRGRVPTAYDGEVTAADEALAPLLGPLLDRGKDSDTLVVLTADHGEGLGDHGEATHGVFAYESTLRVPLVLHNPRLFSRRVVQASARHVDILPTILDAVGLPVPAGSPAGASSPQPRVPKPATRRPAISKR